MIEKLKYLLAGLFVSAAAGCFVACDEDEPVIDQWTATYVYLERPVLGANSVDCNVTHSSQGIDVDAKAKLPVAVCLSKAWASDVNVKLKCALGDGVPEGAVVFRKGGSLVIPAGKLIVRDTLDFVDWSFASEQAENYKVTVEVESVRPVSGNLRASSNQNSLILNVNKAECRDVSAGVVPVGSRIADYTGWSVYATKVDDNNADWGVHQPKLINGDTKDYIWFSAPHMGIKIDMGSTKTVTGLETYSSYGAGYAMSSCSIYTSEDGVAWKSLLPEAETLAMTPRATQYVAFVIPVTARYMIWHMYGSGPLSSEIYVYSK